MTVLSARQQIQHFLTVQFSNNDESVPIVWRDTGYLDFLSLYSMSSFTFAFVAFLLLTVFEGNYDIEPKVPVPQWLTAAILFNQSVVTFVADVIYAGVPSRWHAVDRTVATIGVTAIATPILFVTWMEVLIFAIIVPTGLLLLSNGRMARSGVPEENKHEMLMKVRRGEKVGGLCVVAYARWHAFWHFYYPAGMIAWLAYRQYEDYKPHAFASVVLMASFVLYLQMFNPTFFHHHKPGSQ